MLVLEEDEVLLIKRQATYFYHITIQVIGDLYVTNQRTVFRSKKLHWMQKEDIEISNTEIAGTELFNYFHFVSSGLKITLRDGKVYKFKLLDRERVMEILDTHRYSG